MLPYKRKCAKYLTYLTLKVKPTFGFTFKGLEKLKLKIADRKDMSLRSASLSLQAQRAG